jgi:hypothetical protein
VDGRSGSAGAADDVAVEDEGVGMDVPVVVAVEEDSAIPTSQQTYP